MQGGEQLVACADIAVEEPVVPLPRLFLNGHRVVASLAVVKVAKDLFQELVAARAVATNAVAVQVVEANLQGGGCTRSGRRGEWHT